MIKSKKMFRGDTIIEVIIAISIIGAALGVATSITNKGLRIGVDAKQRTEALAFGQGQVEMIKGEYKNNPSFASTYQVAGTYCLASSSGAIVKKVSSDPACTSNVYATAVTYNLGVFTVITSWANLRSASAAQVTLYYKLPGSF